MIISMGIHRGRIRIVAKSFKFCKHAWYNFIGGLRMSDGRNEQGTTGVSQFRHVSQVLEDHCVDRFIRITLYVYINFR